MNAGTEINGIRPAIVYTPNSTGNDVIVIPLTSQALNKLVDRYDIFVTKDKANKLYQTSYARLRQMRCVSTKRIHVFLGTIANEKVREVINREVTQMLATDK